MSGIISANMKRYMITFLLLLCCNLYALSAGADKPLRIVGDKSYPPFEFINDQGQPDGFNIALIKEVMKRMERPYTIELMEWDDAHKKFSNGNADCMAGLIYTNDRAKNILFSTTHNVITYYVVCRKEDKNKYKVFNDLKNRKIIAPKGEIILQLLSDAGLNDQILYTSDIVEGIKQLSSGKGDIAITFEKVATQIIKDEKIQNLEIIDIGIPPMEYCIAVSNDNNLILQINRVLLAMKKDGTYDDIYNEWFPSAKIAQQKRILYISIGLIIALMLFVYFIINYLRKRVKQATKQLILQKQRYEMLYNNTVVGLEYYDNNGILVDLNEADCLIYGVDKETILNLKPSLYDNPLHKHIDFNSITTKTEIITYDFRKEFRDEYFSAMTSKDEIIYVETTFFVIRNHKGAIQAIIATSINITDKYKTELELKESQEQLELIFKAQDLIFWSYDIKDKKATYKTEKGDPIEWLLGKDKWIFDAQDQDTMTLQFNSIIKGEVATTKDIVHFISPTGEYQYYEVMMTAFHENGVITKVLGTLTNIHEEYTMQEKIKELSISFDLALEAGDVTVWSYDPKKEIFDTIRGNVITTKAITKEEYLEIIHPDDRESNLKILHSLLSGEIDKTSSTQRYADANGIYSYYKNYYITQKKNGVVVNIIGSRENISDEINKQLKLEESIHNLKYALKGMNSVFFEFDVKTQLFKSYNEPLNDFDENKLLTISDYVSIIHPSYKEKILELGNYMKENKHDSFTIEFEQKNKSDDSWRIVSLHLMPLSIDNSGAITKYVGIRNDITDLKTFSQKLFVSNNEKETLLKNLPVIIAIYNSEAKQEYLNDVGYEIFGVKNREAHINKHISIYDDPVIPEHLKERIRKGEEFDVILEYDISQANTKGYFTSEISKSIYLDVKVRYIKGQNGEINKTILIMTDVSGREQLTKRLQNAQNDLLKTNQILNQVLDNIPCVLYIKNASNNYKYVLANKAFCENAGVMSDQIIGRQDQELFKTEHYEKHSNYNQLVIETGESVMYEDILQWQGTDKHWHITKSPLKMPNGDIYIISIATDITKLKQINAELEQEKIKAQTADKLKSAFLANMSHEIRTPLNAIVGFSELLQTTDDASEREEYTNIINHNNDLLLRLIGDILDLSKMESGMVELKPEEFDISTLFEEAFTILRQRCINENIKFISKNPYKSCLITLDKNRLMQVGTNFITNAIKYTTEGQIVMGYEYIDNGIYIYVEDTGIGIPKEKQHLLFQRFAKLDDFAQGTGLGLAISKAIVDACGGKIGVESEVGHGSKFWAWIPCEAIIDYGEHEKLNDSILKPR